MSAAIEIRGYVVGFGDCILLKLPDGNQTRHVLIDFGRAPNDSTSLARFPAIARDIEKQTGAHLDLVVMTHEHLDHMEGFYREREIFDRMAVDRVWMSLPSHPGYYQDFPNARLQKKLRAGLTEFAQQAARNGLALHPAFQSLLENNIANSDRIDYLRKLGKKPVVYLARGRAAASRAFKNIGIKVLAPEPDVSVYYTASARENALTSALAAGNGAPRSRAHGDEDFRWHFPSVARAAASDLGGLSQSDFDRLRRAIREDGVEAARFIDHAQNNTSLCLLIEAAGKRLLLPGDAELESWGLMMRKCGADLKTPVNFLKVAHHGSHNGTPMDMLDRLLPRKNKAHAQVLVSTRKNVYGTTNPVPDKTVLNELRSRCKKLVTTDGMTGTSVTLEL